MMKFNRFRVKWRELRAVVNSEYYHIFHDGGVILVLIIAFLLYSTLYSLAYNNQVLRNVPIGVVDMSHTESSRQLGRLFDAGPNMYVAYNPESMEQAEELFFARKIYGIVYIPHDYETDLLSGSPVTVGVYVDASNFLMYRQVFQEVVSSLTLTGVKVEYNRLVAQGVIPPTASVVTNPVTFQAKTLFNPYLGYGSFIMPAIIIVIIQQTLLIGLGMIGGTWREQGLYRKLVVPGERRLSVVPLILGKSLAYFSIYAATMLYVFGIHYRIFHFPMNGSFWSVVGLLLPYLLACIFMGIALSTCFRKREESIMLLIWTSIPVLLLSGASFPRQAIPEWLYTIGLIFPSTSGVDGFVRIQTMGASLVDVSRQVCTLWILVGGYFLLACFSIRRLLDDDKTRTGRRGGFLRRGVKASTSTGPQKL